MGPASRTAARCRVVLVSDALAGMVRIVKRQGDNFGGHERSILDSHVEAHPRHGLLGTDIGESNGAPQGGTVCNAGDAAGDLPRVDYQMAFLRHGASPIRGRGKADQAPGEGLAAHDLQTPLTDKKRLVHLEQGFEPCFIGRGESVRVLADNQVSLLQTLPAVLPQQSLQ